MDPEQLDNLRPPTSGHVSRRHRSGSNSSAKSSVSGFVDRVAALGTDLGDMTKDMASKVEFGGLTKVTLRSKVIPLDLKKAVRLEISYRGLHLVG